MITGPAPRNRRRRKTDAKQSSIGMPRPEELLKEPRLDEFDRQCVKGTLYDLTTELSRAQGKPVFVGLSTENSGCCRVYNEKIRDVVKRCLEDAGWEVKEVVRWFNKQENDFWPWLRSRYWRVQPGFNYRIEAELARFESTPMIESKEGREDIKQGEENVDKRRTRGRTSEL